MADENEGLPAGARYFREGARWVNKRPTPEEFGAWAKDNIRIDPLLNIEDYVGGIVLIPATDTKAKRVTAFAQDGRPIITESEELAYIPYAKVETRVQYFWDLCAVHGWAGIVEPVASERLEPVGGLAQLVHQLPVGFSLLSVPVGENFTHFLCSTIRVAIYRTNEETGEMFGASLREGRGTKMVPLVLGRNSFFADPNAMMKSETGALGRALGAAGIFTIPGSGIATAEDIMESISQEPTAAQPPTKDGGKGPAAPSAPAVKEARTGAEAAVDEEQSLKRRSTELWKELSATDPARATEFGKWAKERNLESLSAAQGAVLRGVVKKLEKLLDEAKAAAQPKINAEETTDVGPGGGEAAAIEQPEEDPDAVK